MTLTDEITKEIEIEVNKNPEIILDLLLEKLTKVTVICPKRIALAIYVSQKKALRRKLRNSFECWTWRQLREHPEIYPYRNKYYSTECNCGTCNEKHTSTNIKVFKPNIQKHPLTFEGVYGYGT